MFIINIMSFSCYFENILPQKWNKKIDILLNFYDSIPIFFRKLTHYQFGNLISIRTHSSCYAIIILQQLEVFECKLNNN